MSSETPKQHAEILLRRSSTLGEGSLWDVEHQKLYWVDILEHKVFVFDPKDGSNREFDVGQDVGTVVVTMNDQLLLALRSGLASFDPISSRITTVSDPRESADEGRFNDGKCDPKGRFWAGTIAEGAEPTGKGALYCLQSGGKIDRKLSGVTISNGLCWSADQRTFYYVDTPTHQVAAFDYDLETGAIENRRTVIELDQENEGAPDGMTIDAEDQLWIALFNGGKVLRIDPKTAKRTFEVVLPGGGNVTSCAFGGPKLDQLYITTATIGLSREEKAKQPDAGSLYVAHVPFQGVPAFRFSGET